MVQSTSDTFPDPNAWTLEPRESASDISAFAGGLVPIVPPAWRGVFLAERWIAGRACVVQTSVSSTDLIVDAAFRTSFCEFTARFCYEDSEEALVAMRDWDGKSDPPGPWTKEAVTQRLGPGAIDNPAV